MSKPKEEIFGTNGLVHFSVGAVIKRGNKYLLIDRANPPYGFAGIAGHIDEGENPIEALRREIFEESGLTLTRCKLMFEEVIEDNQCAKGVNTHHWYVFKSNVVGKVARNIRETKSIGLYTLNEIKKINLEPVWHYWFKKMNVIESQT